MICIFDFNVVGIYSSSLQHFVKTSRLIMKSRRIIFCDQNYKSRRFPSICVDFLEIRRIKRRELLCRYFSEPKFCVDICLQNRSEFKRLHFCHILNFNENFWSFFIITSNHKSPKQGKQ